MADYSELLARLGTGPVVSLVPDASGGCTEEEYDAERLRVLYAERDESAAAIRALIAERDAAVIATHGECSLATCPIGLFLSSDGELCLKTEYGNNEGRIDAYIVSTGEFFWGENPQTIENQRCQKVRPINREEIENFLRSLSGIDAAVLAEREACAKVCDDKAVRFTPPDGLADCGAIGGCLACAATIRARSNG